MRRRERNEATPLGPNHILGSMLRWVWTPTTGWYVAVTTPLLINNLMLTNRPWMSREVCIDELHAGPPYKEGGPFDLLSGSDGGYESYAAHYVDCRGSYYNTGKAYYQYKGYIMPRHDLQIPYSQSGLKIFDNPATLDDKFEDVSSYGPTGWKMYQPLKPGIDLGVTLGEIRDVPKMFRSTAKRFHEKWKQFKRKRAGKEYNLDYTPRQISQDWLGYQFGWLPFLSDIRSFITTTQKLSARLERMRAFNGQWERRGGIVKRDENRRRISSGSNDLIAPVFNSTFGSSKGHYWDRVSSVKVWFRGRFRYWIPELDTLRWPPALIAQLYGLSITPATLWELMPWSWLIDWVTNVGDVISQASEGSQFNLTASYAYVMGHTRNVDRLTTWRQTYGAPCVGVWDFPLERKQRIEADSPFGFGVQWDGLTIRQLSILSALGISRIKA